MMVLLLLGLGLGFDSFRASAALGALPMRRRNWARIALAFGVCDGLAPLLGLALGKSLGRIHAWLPVVGSVAVGAYGLVVVIKTLRSKEITGADSDRPMASGIPLMLSLDNLAAGVGLGNFEFPVIFSAFTLGFMSFLM